MWQIRWQNYSPKKRDFTFLLIDSCSKSSHVAEQVADLTPLEMVNLDSYL